MGRGVRGGGGGGGGAAESSLKFGQFRLGLEVWCLRFRVCCSGRSVGFGGKITYHVDRKSHEHNYT